VASRIATTAPALRFRDLAGLFGTPGADDDSELARPWTTAGDVPLWFSRAAWALGAVVAAHKDGNPAPRLWLPDFFCNQSAWVARQVGAEITFYPIGEDLAPDWPVCHYLAKTSPPDIFLQVHYFGFPADLTPAREFCDAQRAALIEDAAHVLMRSDRIGHAGDYVLWSPYKHLPIPDGGLLVVRPSATSRRERLFAAARRQGREAPGSMGWLARRLVQRAAPSLAARLRRAPLAYRRDPEPAPLDPTPALSTAARHMIAATGARLAAFSADRVEATTAIYDAFAGTEDLVPPLPPPDGSWTPYRAAFRASGIEIAERWYGRFQAAGLAVETWPDIAPEVRRNATGHTAAMTLRDTLLTLPINADMPPARIAAAYAAVL
jgi:dTDP-4-amino-4,6-dideoxygalactose transaminase